MTLRSALKQKQIFKWSLVSFRALKREHSIFTSIKEIVSFYRDWRAYQKLPKDLSFTLATGDIYPRLFDRTKNTKIDPVYFYQNAWCAKKIFENKPPCHYDVGSKADFVGIISQFVPTTMVDIRPIEVALTEFSFMKGNILELPFKDGEILSLSSLCVIEHIGLGRYGDNLDPFGSKKAAKELTRVLARGGSLYISAPVDDKNRVYFNAHRAFTRDYILELFSPLALAEEKYIYGGNLYDSCHPEKKFGTGLYHFKKYELA